MESFQSDFVDQIRAMNVRYELEVNDGPVNLGADRLVKFTKTIMGEATEGMDAALSVHAATERAAEDGVSFDEDELDALTEVADWLGDMMVFIRSEALKWGIPLEEVLTIIMASNESKLGADGKPIKDANGKFLKGPNYWKPEPKIKELLRAVMNESRVRQQLLSEDQGIEGT